MSTTTRKTMAIGPGDRSVTVARLQELIPSLSPDTPLHIGVMDHHHVGSLLGTLPVTNAQIHPHPTGVTLVLHVPGVS